MRESIVIVTQRGAYWVGELQEVTGDDRTIRGQWNGEDWVETHQWPDVDCLIRSLEKAGVAFSLEI